MIKATKPTIRYIIYNTKHNGGNKIIFEQANRLKARGYTIDILTFFGKKPEWFNLKVKLNHVTSIFKLKTPDILIATFWPTAYVSLFLSAKKRFYFVLGWEEEFSNNIFLRKLALFSLKLPLQTIVISNYLNKKVRLYAKKDSSILQTTGINFSVFKPKKNKNKTIKVLSVISSYKRYKGPDLLKKAVKKIKAIHPEYNFTLVSSSETKPCADVDEFYSNINQADLVKLYQKADVLLVTSRAEGFFIPGLEAMSCKCLVITTRCGGVEEYATENKTAILLKNIDQLWKEDVIEKTLKNKKLVEKLTSNAYRKAKQFSWDTTINTLEKILNNS